MNGLWLTPEQARQIGAHALAEAPREVCGLIGGSGGQARHIIAAPNVATEPETRYEIAPAVLVAGVMQFQAAGLDLIGLYHSHPHGPPAPSRTDLALATYPDAVYLIVGLRTGEPELAAWRLAGGRAERLPLHVGTEPPPPDSGPLSHSQKVAILLSAILAVAAFLAISLSLLPPAPRILP
jgi:proteasome lid subunit RPN8/RPN11